MGGLGQEQVKRGIKGRMDYSFVTAYQLLKDEKGSKKRASVEVNGVNGHIKVNVNSQGWITEPVSSKVCRLRSRILDKSSSI